MHRTVRMCTTLSVRKWTLFLLHQEMYCGHSCQNVYYLVREKMDNVFASSRGILCIELSKCVLSFQQES